VRTSHLNVSGFGKSCIKDPLQRYTYDLECVIVEGPIDFLSFSLRIFKAGRIIPTFEFSAFVRKEKECNLHLRYICRGRLGVENDVER